MNPSREQHSIGSIIAINSCLLYDSIGNEIMNFIKTQCEDINVNPFDNSTKTGELISIGLKFGNLLNDTTKQKQLQIMIIFKILSNDEIDMKIKTITNRIISKFKETDKFKIVGVMSINKNTSNSHELINDNDNENIHLYYGKSFLFHTINNKIYKISANSFSQPNLYQTDKLYNEIEKGLNMNEYSIVWDLFCGMGSIGINIANKVKSVYGFELIQNAIEDAKINMKLNNISNCNFFTMNLQQPETLLTNYPHPDILIVDPNRPGLHPNLIKFISQIKPKQFCYVSCNILTQIFDLNQFLLMNPEYEISYSQPVDMLPHTQHIENIIFLNKSK